MLAASLLFKKIYSNAKASSSSNELMLRLSSLPSLVSRDLFLMQFQVSADSLCCGALAVHRALPGPRTAWQRTFGDGVLHALLTEEPGSQGNLELCCTAPCWHRLWHSLGFQVCMGRARAMAVPAQMQTSPIITGGTLARSGTSSAACLSPVIITRGTEQHWRGSVLIPTGRRPMNN